MSLISQSMFLYGFQVTPLNSSLDFVATSGGPTIQATLRLGYYALSSLLTEIERSMDAADPDNVYTVTADRSYLGGLENRVTIATNGSFLSLLFGSGPRVASSIAAYIGFGGVDRTGATSYTGTQSSGTILIPDYVGYNYLGPDFNQKVFGSVNVAASGKKESIVFAIQRFIKIQFMFERQQRWIDEWSPLVQWMIQQREFDFTPEYTNPNVFYDCTLEQSESDGQGLAFTPSEMIPDFPFYYDTGMMMLRVLPQG